MRSRLLSAGLVAAGLLLAGVAFVAPTGAAWAQEEASPATGFLNPFPPGDVYPVQTLGDTFAEGLVDGLTQALAGEARIQVGKKHRNLEGVMRNDFEDSMKALDEALAKEPVQIAVVMLGASDRVLWKNPETGKRMPIGSDEWRGEYGRRVDRVIRLYKARTVSVYWVGLPSMRRSDANDDAQMMNDIIRERAVANGVRYIDSFQALADEQDGYSDMGPDVTGKVRRLREPDGVNFTEAGNRKLAHFVEKELKRDLTQAKQDRNVPLAGSEPEQAKINAALKAAEAAKAAQAAAPAPTQDGAAATPGGAAPAQPGVPASGMALAAPAAGLDLKADPGRVSLKTVQGGREELVTIEILRPALPASLIAAVTRKESADKPSQMGESLLDQIAGGITVVSSITPANETGAARRKLSPTQSPYFRVLVKGERVVPKPGRADEIVWPRPEPPAFVAEAPKSAAKPAPVAPPPPEASEEPKEKPEKRQRRNRG